MALKKGKNKYPFQKMELPSALKNVENGKLPNKILSKVDCGGVMYINAAKCFNLMYQDALAAGIKFKNIGDYRDFEGQKRMFLDRYDDEPTGRKPQVTRQYEGKIWYLKQGKSPSGTPGTSNHGLGLAIDLGAELKGKLVSLSSHPKAAAWICENGPKYGFFLQGNDPKSPEFELWHWQWVWADKIPADIEARLGGVTTPKVDPVAQTAPAATPKPARQKKAGTAKAAVKKVPAKKAQAPAKKKPKR